MLSEYPELLLKLWIEVLPNFNNFSVHKQKLTELSQHWTALLSHFNNMFLKSFRLLLKLTRNSKMLQNLRFQKSKDISHNFSSIILGFCSVAMYFVNFQYFRKMTVKFQFHSNIFKILVLFQQIQNFRDSNLAMLKVKHEYHSYLAKYVM
jgi:hypothetical protein